MSAKIQTEITSHSVDVTIIQDKCQEMCHRRTEHIPSPHRGLPPCRGGGAYAPMTQTIF